MKRLAHAKRRDMNEQDIVDTLRRIGCSVIRMDVFDILVGYRGKDFKMEIKTDTGKLTKSQIEFEKEWRGSPLYFVRTREQAIDIVTGKIK